MNHCNCLAVLVAVALTSAAAADDAMHAHLMANSGVLVTHGETKVVFDPLFDNSFGYYELVPKDIEDALFAGAPPFDGLDAVFVSHHHEDHFSPRRMVQLLEAQPDLQLFAPRQAIDDMPVNADDTSLLARLHAVDLNLEEQFAARIGEIEVNAVRIPHSGWPDRHAEIDNIAFKVSLNGVATVVHLGDGHTDPKIFDSQAEYWAERPLQLALPPYWFFLSGGGRKILDDHIRADVTIGVHVPEEMPDVPSQYPEELRGRLLFSVPGQGRRIPVDHDAK